MIFYKYRCIRIHGYDMWYLILYSEIPWFCIKMIINLFWWFEVHNIKFVPAIKVNF